MREDKLSKRNPDGPVQYLDAETTHASPGYHLLPDLDGGCALLVG